MFWFCGEEFGSVSLPRHSVNNSHSRCRNLRNDSRENPPKALENNSPACFRDLPSSASCSQMNSLAAKLNNWNLILETRLASLAMIQNHFFLARRLSIKERKEGKFIIQKLYQTSRGRGKSHRMWRYRGGFNVQPKLHCCSCRRNRRVFPSSTFTFGI